MSYPGNPDLADDVQRRVLSTFESMLHEVAKGNHQEALLGCSLIERLDPRFKPVAELRARLEHADDAATGIAVYDLAQMLGIDLPGIDDDAGGAAAPEAEPTPAPHRVDDEHIETVETEAFEDSGERIDVMTGDEMRDFMPELPQPPATESTSEEPATDNAPDEDDRVAALLKEGQVAFDAGEYQTAIDAWSRVFLIDLDHAEASGKVDEARRLLAEREREAEELFHAALEKIESGDSAGARESLEAALERRPGHVAAREHLGRLQAGALGPDKAKTGQPAGATGSEGPPPVPADLSAEPQVPIPPPESLPAEAAVAHVDLDWTTESAVAHVDAPIRKSILSPRFLAIAALGLVVVLAAAWFLYSRRDSVFPNATAPTDTASAHPIDRAQRLHTGGRIDAAIAALERVQPTDARHSEAQTLLERWRQEAALAVTEAQQENEGLAAERADERAELVAAAREAIDSGLPHRALKPLRQAEQIAPLSVEETALREAAQERLRPYADIYLSYLDGDYRTAIRPLWERVRQSPDDAIARDMLISSQFNLARSLLVSGNPGDAAALLSDAAKMVPRDQEVQQALRFAEHYVGTPRDLRYRIFINHMPTR